uniref:uncharacterized protein trim45 isoform X5 n=1 Tax=Gasterosteus aculeatus aculeatus TaxID=481459 RepID=UPI001A97FDEC|nr:uncharacterized protein trim45 isoform X5 [Gasterosteus aculeatus aculeatus]
MSQPEQRGDAEQQTGSPPNPRAVCNVCTRLFRDPKILPCLHTFCADCVGRLEPFAVSSRKRPEDGRSEAAEADRPAGTVTVLCPDCDSEVDLPASGPGGLSTDHLALHEVFLETLATDGPLGCDLCGEGGAESRCDVCCVNLCAFCCQAHRYSHSTLLYSISTVRRTGTAHSTLLYSISTIRRTGTAHSTLLYSISTVRRIPLYFILFLLSGAQARHIPLYFILFLLSGAFHSTLFYFYCQAHRYSHSTLLYSISTVRRTGTAHSTLLYSISTVRRIPLYFILFLLSGAFHSTLFYFYCQAHRYSHSTLLYSVSTVRRIPLYFILFLLSGAQARHIPLYFILFLLSGAQVQPFHSTLFYFYCQAHRYSHSTLLYSISTVRRTGTAIPLYFILFLLSGAQVQPFHSTLFYFYCQAHRYNTFHSTLFYFYCQAHRYSHSTLLYSISTVRRTGTTHSTLLYSISTVRRIPLYFILFLLSGAVYLVITSKMMVTNDDRYV